MTLVPLTTSESSSGGFTKERMRSDAEMYYLWQTWIFWKIEAISNTVLIDLLHRVVSTFLN